MRVKTRINNKNQCYIEIDLTKEELENIKRGSYPSEVILLQGKEWIKNPITTSVGLDSSSKQK